MKEIENVELARRNTHTPCSDGFVGDGQSRSKVPRNCSWCGIYGHMARECRKKTEYMKNNQTSGWSGTDNKTEGKPDKGKSKQDKRKESKPGKGKSKSKSKRNVKHNGKKRKKGLHEMEGHEDKQETQTGQEYTEWTDTSWDHADNWTDGWSSDWSTDLWTDPVWEQAARQLPSTQPSQEQTNPTHGGSILMLGGLMMCVRCRLRTKLTEIGAMIGMTGLKIAFRTR